MPYPYRFRLDFEKDAKYLEMLRLMNHHQYEVLEVTHSEKPQLSYDKVAKRLGIPLNTVKTRLNRGRNKINKWRMMDGITPEGM